MATTYLQLLNGAAASDDYNHTDHNKIVESIDRQARMAYDLFGSGRVRGWLLNSGAATVSSGAGQVGPCWCVTTVAQAISGLVNGATNYVHARTIAGSPASGTVQFVARATSAALANYDGVSNGFCVGKASYVTGTGLKTISTGPTTKHLITRLSALL